MKNARDQFIEQTGLMTQAEGLPRIAGQVLGYLIVEGEARTLTQMTEALKISKGSASTNARLLEHKGAVRRISVLGQRQDAYEAVEEPGLSTLTEMATRFHNYAETIEGLAAKFGEADEGARDRVLQFAEFHRQSAVFFDEWINRMCAQGVAEKTKEE